MMTVLMKKKCQKLFLKSNPLEEINKIVNEADLKKQQMSLQKNRRNRLLIFHKSKMLHNLKDHMETISKRMILTMKTDRK